MTTDEFMLIARQAHMTALKFAEMSGQPYMHSSQTIEAWRQSSLIDLAALDRAIIEGITPPPAAMTTTFNMTGDGDPKEVAHQVMQAITDAREVPRLAPRQRMEPTRNNRETGRLWEKSLELAVESYRHFPADGTDIVARAKRFFEHLNGAPAGWMEQS